jgi:hypothetical protein
MWAIMLYGDGRGNRVELPRSMKPFLKMRSRSPTWYLLAVVLTIVAGLASRHFPRILPTFLGKYPGDVLWALMVFFVLGAIFRTASSVLLSVGALGFSFGIEALKLCNAPLAGKYSSHQTGSSGFREYLFLAEPCCILDRRNSGLDVRNCFCGKSA